MKIEKDYDLTKLNTFGISVRGKFFAEVKSEADFKELLEHPIFKENEKLFLGGGSNVLFTKDFAGIVILNKITGIELLKEDSEYAWIKAMSGEVWHDLVQYAVTHEYWGIENLSLIPGSVGAAPMQNIGAYGAELRHVLESIEAVNVNTGERKVFKGEECNFGYRDSIFKNELKGQYFILSITLRLSKKERKNITYKVLKEHLEKNNLEVRGPKDISDAVSDIRRSKLPDPSVIGNAGSFFKNVFVDEEVLRELLSSYPDMPHFNEDGMVKIPAAWLIEHCGPADGASWKGKKIGETGVHDKQALVIVNHGSATGQEVKDLATEIIDSVYKKFNLTLIPEVNII